MRLLSSPVCEPWATLSVAVSLVLRSLSSSSGASLLSLPIPLRTFDRLVSVALDTSRLIFYFLSSGIVLFISFPIEYARRLPSSHSVARAAISLSLDSNDLRPRLLISGGVNFLSCLFCFIGHACLFYGRQCCLTLRSTCLYLFVWLNSIQNSVS